MESRQQGGLAGHRNKPAFYSARAQGGTDRSRAREGPDSTHVLLAHSDCVYRVERGLGEAKRPGTVSLVEEREEELEPGSSSLDMGSGQLLDIL